MADQTETTAPPVPEMREAIIDAGTVEELFDDLAGCTAILGVSLRAAPQRHTSAGSISLTEACRQLLGGEVRAVQVRYRFDQAEWTDTLMRVGVQFRLVRCKH